MYRKDERSTKWPRASQSLTFRPETRSSCLSRWPGPRFSVAVTSSSGSMHSTTADTLTAVPSSLKRSNEWLTWQPRPGSRAAKTSRFTLRSLRFPRQKSFEGESDWAWTTALRAVAMIRRPQVNHADSATHASSGKRVSEKTGSVTPYVIRNRNIGLLHELRRQGDFLHAPG